MRMQSAREREGGGRKVLVRDLHSAAQVDCTQSCSSVVTIYVNALSVILSHRKEKRVKFSEDQTDC